MTSYVKMTGTGPVSYTKNAGTTLAASIKRLPFGGYHARVYAEGISLTGYQTITLLTFSSFVSITSEADVPVTMTDTGNHCVKAVLKNNCIQLTNWSGDAVTNKTISFSGMAV